MDGLSLKGINSRAILMGVVIKVIIGPFFGLFVITLIGVAHVMLYGNGAEPISTTIMQGITVYNQILLDVVIGVVTYKFAKDSPVLNLGIIGTLLTLRSLMILNHSTSNPLLWAYFSEVAPIFPSIFFGGWLARVFPHIGKIGFSPTSYRIAFLLLLNTICLVRAVSLMDLFTLSVDPKWLYFPPLSSAFIPAILAWIVPCCFFWAKGFRAVRLRKTILLLGLLIAEWPLLLVFYLILTRQHENPFLKIFIAHLSGHV